MNNKQKYFFKSSSYNRFITILAISSLLALSSCSSINSGKSAQIISYKADRDNNLFTDENSVATRKGVTQVVDANNQFAISMYQQLNKDSAQTNENIFFSPYSLSSAMAMLYAAAEGETKAQIQETFSYPSSDILNPNNAVLYEEFNTPYTDYKLAVVNNIWVQKGLTPNQTYTDTIQHYYDGQMTALDFETNPNGSRQTINTKVAQQTEQMILELLPASSIQSATAMVLTNAVYFKGDWKTPFTAQSTSLQPFYNNIGKFSEVKMMHQKSYFEYIEDKQVQVVQLPYKGNDLSMLVVLPKSRDKAAIQQLVKNLSTAQVSEWTAKLEKKELSLYLPKFKLKERYQMKTLLANMGMPRAFENRAEFNLFEEPLPIKIDEIYHQAVVAVDEKGTEAAAATAIVGMYAGMSYPMEFKADHPFMFIIKHNQTDAILFLGQVNKP